MKPLFKKGLSAVLAAALTVSMAATAFATPNAEDTVITVLHTNDVHGAVVSDDSGAVYGSQETRFNLSNT